MQKIQKDHNNHLFPTKQIPVEENQIEPVISR